MTSEEIKDQYETACAHIIEAQNKIYELRQICKHEKFHKGIYSWRPGSYSEENICDYCGEVLNSHNEN